MIFMVIGICSTGVACSGSKAGMAGNKKAIMKRCIAGIVGTVCAGMIVTSCHKKPVIEVDQVHEMLERMKGECASVYARDELEKIQPHIDHMDSLAEVEGRKQTREKALDMMEALKLITGKVENAKENLRNMNESEQSRAEKALHEAEKAGARIYAAELFSQAIELKDRGSALYDRSDCDLEQSLELFKSSIARSEDARKKALAQMERMAREEEERRRMESLKVEEPPKREEIREWIVKKGDTLWGISAESDIFGTPFLWPLIFWANRSQIKEPDTIYEGQRLKIPRDVTAHEVEQALKKAKSKDISGIYDSLNGK